MAIRALVVDDEASIHELLSEYLRGRGLVVEVARSGREAKALLGAGAYDVLLTDLKLADADGLEIVAHGAEQVPAVPAVVMTGYATVESAISALRMGAMDFVLKPFKLRDVYAILVSAAERGRDQNSAAATLDALRFLERAVVAEGRAEAVALLPGLAQVLARLPGAASVDLTLGKTVIAAHGPPVDIATSGDLERWPLPGGYVVSLSPLMDGARPFLVATDRALKRAGF